MQDDEDLNAPCTVQMLFDSLKIAQMSGYSLLPYLRRYIALNGAIPLVV
jgi:hypothetical protein